MAQTGIHYEKINGYGEITMKIYSVGLCAMPFP